MSEVNHSVMSAYSEASFESYDARADAKRAKDIAKTESPFHIEVRFLGGLSQTQMQVFKDAADRWTKLIVGDLPDVIVSGEVIDDVRIFAQGTHIDGVGGVLGQAGPTLVRPPSAGRHAFLTVTGTMQFDTADLASMESQGILNDVITHEMGHVIGCTGFVWENKGLVTGKETENWAFTGPLATAEYGKLGDLISVAHNGSNAQPKPVPVENRHGPGTAGSHWRETVLGNELMTGFVAHSGGNPLSRVTGGMFGDIGYDVDLNACDPYQLPSHLLLAEMGLLAGRDYEALGVVLPTIPLVASEESMDTSRLGS